MQPKESRHFAILLFNQYYPPDTAATAFVAQSFANALAASHIVKVLAGRPSYDPTECHGWYITDKKMDGEVVVERVGSSGYSRRQMRSRVMNYLSYILLAVPKALTMKADLVLAMTDPPLTGIMAAATARLCQKPFVYFVQDLHPDMALACGLIRDSTFVRLWEKLHHWALSSADVAIVLGEDMRQRIADKGVNPDRIAVVRTGATFSDTAPVSNHQVSMKIRNGLRLVILHAGNIGFYGAWKTLIHGVCLLKNNDIGLVFVGEGAKKPALQDLAQYSRQVRFLPFFPSDQVPFVLSAADVHVICIRRGLEGLVVPSKIYPILGAGKPVLAVAPEESDVARIVAQEKCGLVADPDDPSSVTAAVKAFSDDRGRLREMGENAKRAASKYKREHQLERFVQIVSKVLRSAEGVGKSH